MKQQTFGFVNPFGNFISKLFCIWWRLLAHPSIEGTATEGPILLVRPVFAGLRKADLRSNHSEDD
jgi:hypothetical protein